MKTIPKIITIIIVALILSLLMGISADATGTSWTVRQQQAHELAELARSMGLPEDDPIIVRAKELWCEDEGKEQDIAILARVMFWEEGRDITCEADLTDEKTEKIMLVGKTVCNRVNDSRFPSSVFEVVAQKGQYLPAYANMDSRYNVPESVLNIFEDLARRVLDGEPFDCPNNVIFADTKKHGTGVYKSFYNAALGNTTYFCYG